MEEMNPQDKASLKAFLIGAGIVGLIIVALAGLMKKVLHFTPMVISVKPN